MRRVLITREERPETKVKWTFWQRIALASTGINLLLSFCLALYSISTKWGSSTLGLIWLGLLGFYALVFSIFLLISMHQSASVLKSRLKYSIKILKFLTGISNLVNLFLTLSMLIVARLKGDMSNTTTTLSILALFLIAIISLLLNIKSLKKRKK